jgi:hypothetical protein
MVAVAAPQVMLAMATPATETLVTETPTTETPVTETVTPQENQAKQLAISTIMVSDRTASVAILPYLNLGPVTGGKTLSLLKVGYEHPMLSSTQQSAITFFSSNDNVRRDWFMPVNYANGSVYQRLEVVSKPSNELIYYQLCLVPNDDISIRPACSRASGLSFSQAGVYEFTQPLSSFYEYYNIDWSRGIHSLMVIIRDKDGRTLDIVSAERSGQRLEGYFPMQVKYDVALVPSGGNFQGW